MAAIDTALAGPQTLNNLNRLAKRGNWASQEAGVIVVFCIVFIGETPCLPARLPPSPFDAVPASRCVSVCETGLTATASASAQSPSV